MQRLIDHEIFEMAMLHWLGSKRLLASLAFGGETMLRLCHELPRYSLDMDFWFFKKDDDERFCDRLSSALSQDYDIIEVQNNSHSIVVEIQNERRMPKLKIQIRKTVAPPGSTEEKIAFSPYSPTQVLVRGFTLRQMLKGKVRTLIDRGEIRDAFDMEFLVRKGVGLNLSEEQKEKIVRRLRGFKKKDFDVILGLMLLPELRDYYKKQGFAYLEEKLSFEHWGNEGGKAIDRIV